MFQAQISDLSHPDLRFVREWPSFPHREKRLEGKDKAHSLALVRKILRCDPEERPSAEQLFEDEFLTRCQGREEI